MKVDEVVVLLSVQKPHEQLRTIYTTKQIRTSKLSSSSSSNPQAHQAIHGLLDSNQ